jgi:hypothetical protein
MVKREVGWEDDWPGGEGVIDGGYNRVGIDGRVVEWGG